MTLSKSIINCNTKSVASGKTKKKKAGGRRGARGDQEDVTITYHV